LKVGGHGAAFLSWGQKKTGRDGPVGMGGPRAYPWSEFSRRFPGKRGESL
jgi:hypothetical protein